MTRHIKRLVVNSLLVGSTLCAYPATVSVDDARAIATEFMRARTGEMSGEIGATPVFTAGTASKPLYYVFNTTDNAGFVIISAEDATAPVLGYSFEGAYPAASQPEAMKWMMAGVEREIKAAPTLQKSNTIDENKRKARAAAQYANGQKLLATPSWSQEAPFNSMIPGQPLVGCVGTAMATIMKYHNWPEQGTGEFDGVDFGVTYDWDSMRSDNYRSGYTAAEGEAVATIMYHASKSIDTQYAMSGSSAYEVRVPGALSTYFGYDPGVSYKKRAEVATQADWDNIVINEINEGRPVLYCGQDVTAGHAFVCDGYQGEYLHFNWGWGGSANGYFLSTALNPTVSRTHHYNNLNTIIYNIKPATGSTAWSPIHITADGNQVGLGSDLTDLSSGKKFTVRAGNLKNLSYADFSGKLAVALCDATGNVKALLSSTKNLSLQSMGYLFDGDVEFTNCALPGATVVADSDRVRLVTQANGASEWLPVAGELPTTNELAPVVDSPASFAITLPTGAAGVTVTGEDNVIQGWDYTFKVVPENPDAVVVTVKANRYVLTPSNQYSYTIKNVRESQDITALVQNAADVKEKRSVWVGTPGTLSSIISEEESGVIKELTLFGTLDARDFEFMRNSMRLTRVDLTGVYIAAHGSNQANALPRNAFRGKGSLKEVILPNNL
ncbi:MAG: C10 family peptidase, partial [Muribaculaceae bacterium]|nr:C10 family peptidase [Muribaculaceae bacterium]